MIKDADPFFQKEVSVSEDEVTITIKPPSSYQAFRYIKGKDKKAGGNLPTVSSKP